ncbi:hypothetical protein DB30_05604 [Enhygromyxa salina]|uniref:Uncharacterized protein n=1 Tax=Enhygromyxa salina TaxID=215803 RepID=A0A0C1ZWH4_9BACT|nr:hypothetical protein DB30_05604 [Enhygromyxa salina]
MKHDERRRHFIARNIESRKIQPARVDQPLPPTRASLLPRREPRSGRVKPVEQRLMFRQDVFRFPGGDQRRSPNDA